MSHQIEALREVERRGVDLMHRARRRIEAALAAAIAGLLAEELGAVLRTQAHIAESLRVARREALEAAAAATMNGLEARLRTELSVACLWFDESDAADRYCRTAVRHADGSVYLPYMFAPVVKRQFDRFRHLVARAGFETEMVPRALRLPACGGEALEAYYDGAERVRGARRQIAALRLAEDRAIAAHERMGGGT